jgi:Chitobiase/beta-hexosaminidase C-terminal domain
VQTNYQSVQFSSPVYSSAQNLPVSPAPVVTVIENGQSIGGVPITLLFSGALNTVSGLGPVTTAGVIGAAFSNLVVTALGDDTLSLNLPIALPTALGGTTIQPAALNATATLNITAQTITFTAPSSITYGAAPITLSATSTSTLAVTFSVTSGPATISSNTLTITGVGSVVITANQAGDASYVAATPVSRTIVVNPIGMVAAPTFTPVAGTYTSPQSVTIADSTGASIYYTTDGSTPGAGTGTSTLYNGTAISVAKSETINAIGVLVGYTNSAVAPAAYVLNLPVPAISNPTLSATSLTVAPGSAGTLMALVTGTGGFNSPVTFGCSGLPASATCSFNPATVTPSDSAAAATTLTVSIATGATVGAVRHNSNPLFPGATFAVALCFLGFRKRRGLQMLLLFTVSAIGLSLFTGCSGSPASTASTSTVTVTARAAGVQSTTSSFTLTVQ